MPARRIDVDAQPQNIATGDVAKRHDHPVCDGDQVLPDRLSPRYEEER
jgi:hypothetical protein